MTESAYARDPRVVWHDSPQCFTVQTGADPPPAVYQGAIDGDPDVWVCRPDPPWERIEGVPDSRNVDDVFYALIGEPQSMDEHALLLWAGRTDEGWLHATVVAEMHDGPGSMARLVEQGMFVYHEEYDAYYLTTNGVAKAAMLDGEG